MNELPGTMRDGGGVDVAGVGHPAAGSQAPGSSVLLLVRPEDVSLTALNGDASGLAGTVVTRVFAGPTTLVRVRVDTVDTLVTANVPGAAPFATGERVAVHLDTHRALVEAAP